MKYNTHVVIGSQWGDEGKGKISDYLAQSAEVVVRYQGGNNAGHTIKFNGQKYALKHIPSGIFNPNTLNIMAQGMVVNPKMLIDEIEYLKDKGIKEFKLAISDRAHVILPFHLALDAAHEAFKEGYDPSKKIGTTKKGIGPAYSDKINRIGLRFGDFIDPESFKNVLKMQIEIKNKELVTFGEATMDFDEIFDEYIVYAENLKKYVTETGYLLENEIKAGKKVIFEGAQGIMLCIDNGTYPFVTSSSPTASAVPLGTGINNKLITRVTGIIKAYTSRVGAGPMATSLEEVEPKLAQAIREKGNEFGTVTGRPRSIGWLDAVALRHANRVSGFTDICVTLLDVLDELPEIKIAYAYLFNGEEINYIPGSVSTLKKCQPIYKTFKGWMTDTTNIKSYDELPEEAKAYIKGIEELLDVPVKYFSVGPDRTQTIEIYK